MAQNNNRVEYVHTPNPGVAQAPPPGQTYQLPPSSLAGQITMLRRNYQDRSITDHKRYMGFQDDDAGKQLYTTWRSCVRDQMMARNYVPGDKASTYPDADFQPIVAGMRRLRPSCDELATAAAANNQVGVRDTDEAVVQIVKDRVRKVFNSIKTGAKQAPLQQPGVPAAQQDVDADLLPPGAPVQWGLATAVPNIGPVPQNAPPANAPAAAPLPALPAHVPAPAPILPVQPANNPAPAPVVLAPPANNPAPAQIVLAPPANNPVPAPVVPAPPANNPVPAQVVPPAPVNNPAPAPIVPAPLANNPAPVPVVPALPQNIPGTPALIVPAPLANNPAPVPVVPAPPANNPVPAQVVPAPPANYPAPAPFVPALPQNIPGTPAPIIPAPPAINPAPAPQVPAPPIDDPAPPRILPGVPENRPVPNHTPTDWSALLGRPRAVRIVYVQPSRRAQGLPAPDYASLHWRPPHVYGVSFAELDSYDLRGLSAMIYRSVTNRRVRYIIGATGEGRRSLRRSPGNPLTPMNYMFIESSEAVRTWLLSNPVGDDPLDLMLYCHRDQGDPQPNTPPLPGLNYLDENDVQNWAHGPVAHIGQMHVRALHQEARPDPGQAGAADEQEEVDASDSSGSSEDDSDAADPGEDLSRMLPTPVGERTESAANRTPLAARSPRWLNRAVPMGFVHRTAQGDKMRKPGAQCDAENCDDGTPKRLRLSSMAKAFPRPEARKRGAEFDDGNCEEHKSKRLRQGSVVQEG